MSPWQNLKKRRLRGRGPPTPPPPLQPANLTGSPTMGFDMGWSGKSHTADIHFLDGRCKNHRLATERLQSWR